MNFRWFLDVSGYKNSVIYLVNGLTATLLFGIVRTGYIISFYLKTYEQWNKIIAYPAILVITLLLLANLVHILNIIWFYKIMKGLIKVSDIFKFLTLQKGFLHTIRRKSKKRIKSYSSIFQSTEMSFVIIGYGQ
jgi:hypothetical protein